MNSKKTGKLGDYLNGYKYGVEYPTNGMKPDLPAESLKLELRNIHFGTVTQTCDSNFVKWENVKSFRIVDERYKPASRLHEPRVNEFEPSVLPNITHADLYDDEWVELDNSWHDRGDWPPVGVECEVSNCGNDFVWCKINYMGSHLCVVDHKTHNDQHYHLGSVKFRPIKSERERFGLSLYRAVNYNSSDYSDEQILALTRFEDYCKPFDAGFRAPD